MTSHSCENTKKLEKDLRKTSMPKEELTTSYNNANFIKGAVV